MSALEQKWSLKCWHDITPKTITRKLGRNPPLAPELQNENPKGENSVENPYQTRSQLHKIRVHGIQLIWKQRSLWTDLLVAGRRPSGYSGVGWARCMVACCYDPRSQAQGDRKGQSLPLPSGFLLPSYSSFILSSLPIAIFFALIVPSTPFDISTHSLQRLHVRSFCLVTRYQRPLHLTVGQQ